MTETPHITALEEGFNPHTLNRVEIVGALSQITDTVPALSERRKLIVQILNNMPTRKEIKKKRREVEDGERKLERVIEKKANVETAIAQLKETLLKLSVFANQKREAWNKILDRVIPGDYDEANPPRIIVTIRGKTRMRILESKAVPIGDQNDAGATMRDREGVLITLDRKCDNGWLSIDCLKADADEAEQIFGEWTSAEGRVTVLSNSLRKKESEQMKLEQQANTWSEEKNRLEKEITEQTQSRETHERELEEANRVLKILRGARRTIESILKEREECKSVQEERRTSGRLMVNVEKEATTNEPVELPSKTFTQKELERMQGLGREKRRVVRANWSSEKITQSILLDVAESCSTSKVLRMIIELSPTPEECEILLELDSITTPHVKMLERSREEKIPLSECMPKEQEKEDYSNALKGLKILYIGGGTGDLKRLAVEAMENAGAEVNAQSEVRIGTPVGGYDLVVINNRVCSHSVLYHYRNACNGSGKLVGLPLRIRPSTIVKFLSKKLELRRASGRISRVEN